MTGLYTIDGTLIETGGGIPTKDTVGVEDAYTTYPMADLADSVSIAINYNFTLPIV